MGVDRPDADEGALGTEPVSEATLSDLLAEHKLARRVGDRAPGSGVRGDDRDPFKLLVSPPMVAVGVAVDERLDRYLRGQRRDRGEHPPGQKQIPQRVHQKRRPVAHHQAGVALADRSVRLQPRVDAGSDLAQTALESGCVRVKWCDRGVHGLSAC